MSRKVGRDYAFTGAAGEFIVAAELSRRGVIATLTLKNTPLIDIIATNLEKGLTANIQVKTRSKSNRQGWVLGKKVEEESTITNLCYVFVNLKELNELPDYYIIPHNTFARFVRRNHQAWLAGRSRSGKVRRDSSIRDFKPDTRDKEFGAEFEARWEVLGIL